MGTCVQGRIAKLEISTDGGSTYDNLPGLLDATLNTSTDEIECTDHDSTTREYLPNFLDATMDASFRWEEDDAIQTALRGVVLPPTSFKIHFYLNSGAGNVRYEADAFATAFNVTAPLDDTAGFDLTLRLSNLTEGVTV